MASTTEPVLATSSDFSLMLRSHEEFLSRNSSAYSSKQSSTASSPKIMSKELPPARDNHLVVNNLSGIENVPQQYPETRPASQHSDASSIGSLNQDTDILAESAKAFTARANTAATYTSKGARDASEPTTHVDAVYSFDSPEHFADIQKKAAGKAFALEVDEIDEFNKKKHIFKAFPLSAVPTENGISEEWLLLVEYFDFLEPYLPTEGSSCKLRIIDPYTKNDISVFWTAERVPNRFASNGNQALVNYLVFKIKLAARSDKVGPGLMEPVIPRGSMPQLREVTLDESKAIYIAFFFEPSDSTLKAELGALEKMLRADPKQVDSKQLEAFKYMLTFRTPSMTVDLHDRFPHLRNIAADPHRPFELALRYATFNCHQQLTFDEMLRNIPCGIGMVPGGPGGGKTYWSVTTIGLIQYCTKAKVLYLLDMNKPLDDVMRKYVKMCTKSNLKKVAIRLANFSYELKNSVKVTFHANPTKRGSKPSKDDDPDAPDVNFVKHFLEVYKSRGSRFRQDNEEATDGFLTLDEAAWQYYEQHSERYKMLKEVLDDMAMYPVDPTEHRLLKWQVFNLYKDTLQNADFVAATPVIASTYFNQLFKPDLVFFDEAAHAHELSILTAIANFCPAAWIFIGDFRQTLPFVRDENQNMYAKQLLVTPMQRADRAGAIKYSLLVNHRAYGNLHKLPSEIIYNNQMISGIPEGHMYPASVCRLMDVFGRDVRDGPVIIPRFFVQPTRHTGAARVGTSWWSPDHLKWSIKRCLELLQDPQFVSVEDSTKPGTIMLTAPYKAAVKKYQAAIDQLAKEHPNIDVRGRLEARTWDTAQGHEADVVGIDYVRNVPTTFMDGMHRFNVGLTRARQAEWHLVHRGMVNKDGFKRTQYLKKLYMACSRGSNLPINGHLAYVDVD